MMLVCDEAWCWHDHQMHNSDAGLSFHPPTYNPLCEDGWRRCHGNPLQVMEILTAAICVKLSLVLQLHYPSGSAILGTEDHRFKHCMSHRWVSGQLEKFAKTLPRQRNQEISGRGLGQQFMATACLPCTQTGHETQHHWIKKYIYVELKRKVSSPPQKRGNWVCPGTLYY